MLPKKNLMRFNAANDASFFIQIGPKYEFNTWFGIYLPWGNSQIYSPSNFGKQFKLQWCERLSHVLKAARKLLSWLGFQKQPFAIFFYFPALSRGFWLAYIRKKYIYTDHLIFSFHNTSLLFILLIISYLIDSNFDIYRSWLFEFVFLIYLLISMK